MGALLIISTYPDKKSVTRIAKLMVKERLVACVNFTKINSIYIWNKKLENTSEFLAFFKTTDKKKNLLKNKIKISHPYQVPEILEIKIKSVNKLYLDWLMSSTSLG